MASGDHVEVMPLVDGGCMAAVVVVVVGWEGEEMGCMAVAAVVVGWEGAEMEVVENNTGKRLTFYYESFFESIMHQKFNCF